jgi:tartrate-resistant acid phosphatase type 5
MEILIYEGENFMKRKAFALLILAFLLSACASPVSSPVPMPLPTTALPTNVASQPPVVVLPTDTATVAATLLPTVTAAPTLTPEPQSVKFAVIGDFGLDGPAEADVSALIHGWKPDFIITVGDNNYPSGAASTIDVNIGKYYHDYIFPYVGTYGSGSDINRFFPTLGNHDWYTPNAQPYFDYFTLPGNERYYDFTWGPLHFFALDSDEHEPDGVNAGSVQAAWLKADLAASTSPWNIVYNHYPPFSSGSMHGSTDWMQWPFAAWGANAVLAGHEHLYERLLVDGIPYFTNGSGGGSLYNFGTPLPESQFRYSANYGAMLVTASDTDILFEFYNRVGKLIDSYQLTKH